MTELVGGLFVSGGDQVVEGAEEHRLRQRVGESPGLTLFRVKGLPGANRFVVLALGELRRAELGLGVGGRRTWGARDGLERLDGSGAVVEADVGKRCDVAGFDSEIERTIRLPVAARVGRVRVFESTLARLQHGGGVVAALALRV